MRIFRTCRVMNISTVAVYTHVDRGALHVRYAEEAYCISESPEDTSYLKPELILSIAKKTGAAIHPGYGFLSENADFARRCEEEGVIFIGPGADIIAKMGIKTEARKIMREAGLPIVPGTEAPVQGIEDKRENAELKKLLENEKLKNEKVQAQYDELEVSYTNLKTATAISLNGSDVKETKLRLSKLVREVDKCIALLNE